MAYTKTDWTNETPNTTPIKYKITLSNGTVLAADATIELITSVTPGTPLNSTNMNKIEQGIHDATDLAENIATGQLLDGILSADAAGRAKMADTFITLAKMSADLRFQKLAEFVANGTTQPDWTSIPGTFKHLIMIYNGVSSRTTAGYDPFFLRVNGDTTVNYATADQSFSGTPSAFEVPNPSADGLLAGILPAQNAGHLQTGSGVVIFPDYAGTAFYKSCLTLAAYYGTYAVGLNLSISHRYSADPITRLTGYMNSGGTLYYPRAGSVFSLYGFN